jgi:hypothetical protein
VKVCGSHGARTRRPEVIILGAAPGSSESMREVIEDPTGLEPVVPKSSSSVLRPAARNP